MANLFTDIPEKEPISFYKGETIVWKRTDIGADYAPSSYSMVWEASLESDGSTRFSATASYTAGDYFWVLKVIQTSDSEKLVIDSGKLTVKDNFFATTGDTRSHAKVMLDKIESILENRADADVSSYSIAGRSLNKLTVEELLRWRDYYRAEYKQEVAEFRIGNNEGSGRVVKVQFNDIS